MLLQRSESGWLGSNEVSPQLRKAAGLRHVTSHVYPYEKPAEFHAQCRAGHTEDAIPSIPYIGSGWNPRPWGDPRPAFQLPDRQQWKAALETVKTDLGSGKFGLPLSDRRLQPAVTIYCWNEFGEGGMVAPTQGDRYMKLEVIREVFGTAAQ